MAQKKRRKKIDGEKKLEKFKQNSGKMETNQTGGEKYQKKLKMPKKLKKKKDRENKGKVFKKNLKKMTVEKKLEKI